MAWASIRTTRVPSTRTPPAEMQAHLDLAIEELVDRGVPPESPAPGACCVSGNVRVKLEEAAEMSRLSVIDSNRRDLRYAFASSAGHLRSR